MASHHHGDLYFEDSKPCSSSSRLRDGSGPDGAERRRGDDLPLGVLSCGFSRTVVPDHASLATCSVQHLPGR